MRGIFPQKRAGQPQSAARIDRSNPLAKNVRLAFNAAAPVLRTNIGTRATGPGGIGLVSNTDNAFQFERDLVLQNADTVTVQALLYAPGTPSGSNATRIFGTRGSTQGSSNRRGWEVSLDGGTLVDVGLQVFDSSSNRSTLSSGSSYTGASVSGKTLTATFQVVRTVGTNTVLTFWLKTPDQAEVTGSVTIAVPFSDDGPLANFPEICGAMAGQPSPAADFQVLGLIARTGTIGVAERQAYYSNPWQLFAAPPRQWLIDVAATGTIVTVDGPACAEWSAQRQVDMPCPIEFVASQLADAVARAEWSAAFRADATSPIELNASLRIDGPAPAEWTGQVQISADARVPLEWSATYAGDSRTHIDYVAAQRLDATVAAEYLMLRSIDATAPVQLLAGVQVDGVARADWTGAVTVTADGNVPIEWAGGLLVTANSTMPVEFGAGVRTDGQGQATWSAAVLLDQRVPADFNVGLVTNQQAALEWLRSVFGDAVMPGETLAVIARDTRIPADFGGASSFMPGNLEIFTVDQRGFIWRVETRGTVWVAATRGKIWFPEPR